MDHESEANRRHWDERAGFHLDTPMYREFVARLHAGQDALLPFDDALLPALEGLDVLHLQCHVGTDTLSLKRRGARSVVGVDFSLESLARARALSRELGIEATFVQGDSRALDDVGGPFDLVYTSYGVLCWLDTLDGWAGGAAQRLRPGGRMVVIDTHPLAHTLPEDGELRLHFPYLNPSTPLRFDEHGSYADPSAQTSHNETFEWSHGLGDIVTALLDAGLTLESLTEYPEDFYPRVPTMVRGDDRLWRLPEPEHGRYPLVFSVVGRKP